MIEVFQRNSLNKELSYINTFNGVDTPVDISNMIFTFIVKRLSDKSNNDLNAVIKKVVNLGSNEDTLNGIFTLNLTSNDTDLTVNAKAKPGEYICEFQLSKIENGINNFITLKQDTFVIKSTEIKV